MAKRAPARRRPRKAKAGTKGLDPAQCKLETPDTLTVEATEAVEKAGGCVIGLYKEPLGGHATLLSILPIDKIEPTPFQRDLSDAHHKRLADVINKTGYFLDPLIAVLAPVFSLVLTHHEPQTVDLIVAADVGNATGLFHVLTIDPSGILERIFMSRERRPRWITRSIQP